MEESTMKSYLDILHKIIADGVWKQNRTGIKTKSISGHMFEHDMRTGFPAVTTKKLAFKVMSVELEGFIKGITSKKWYQERECFIWNPWANPEKILYGTDEESKKLMLQEDDLGRIYGAQWRQWRFNQNKDLGSYSYIDQLRLCIENLKKNPLDRRNIVMAWNPAELNQMALPPCHYCFQVLSDGEYVDLLWNQRSCDVPLGVPFNIASYGLLLELMARETNLKPRKLIGFLADCHIYENQMPGVLEQIKRESLVLPKLEISDFTSIFDWTYDQAKLINYQNHGIINFPIAV